MAGMMAIGDALENSGIKGLVSAADRQAQAEMAADRMKAQGIGNAINTMGSAFGVAAIGAVKAKKSGILNDIF